MEEKTIYYIYRTSDKRYKTYSETKPEASNYTTQQPPQFNAECEFPYFNTENNSWELRQIDEE